MEDVAACRDSSSVHRDVPSAWRACDWDASVAHCSRWPVMEIYPIVKYLKIVANECERVGKKVNWIAVKIMWDEIFVRVNFPTSTRFHVVCCCDFHLYLFSQFGARWIGLCNTTKVDTRHSLARLGVDGTFYVIFYFFVFTELLFGDDELFWM